MRGQQVLRPERACDGDEHALDMAEQRALACMLRAANGFLSSGFIERAGVADSRSEISGLAPAMVVWTPASQLELA